MSLGLKKSYFDSDLTDSINDNENISHGPEMSGNLSRTLVLPRPEPRGSVPPLQVSLDEYEGSDQESDRKGDEIADGTESNVKKSDKRLKEKRKRKQRFSPISFSFYFQQWDHRLFKPFFFLQGNRNQCLGRKVFTERYTADSR